MFRQRTLFIVGAGASAEFGLPVGPALAAKISERLDIKYSRWSEESASGDLDLFEKIQRRWPNEGRKYQQAAWQIRDGVRLSSSIDDFLDVHATNEYIKRVGKSAIVKTILEYERRSLLYVDQSNIYNKLSLRPLEESWLIKFMRMLSRGVPPEKIDVIFDNVAFIVFNYDRCIEQFLFNALQLQYSVDRKQAGSLVKKLDIIHPYGAVGDLPMEVQGGVQFGGRYSEVDEDYTLLSEAIRTYTEQIEDESELESIRSQIERASNIVFLGFAFHDQNIALLKPRNPVKRKNIYGTAFGMSENDVSVVSSQLSRFFDDPGRATFQSHTHISQQHKCSELFDFYGKSLPA
jgi:hypothetical protein